MNKQDMLDAIEVARKLHKKEMTKIEALIKGQEIETPTALGKMECACGQLFYSNADMMKKILGLQLYEKLDKTHENWHKDYSRIYEIYENQKKRKSGFLSKLMSKEMDPLELDKLRLYHKELMEITEELLRQADLAVRRITALPDSKFQ